MYTCILWDLTRRNDALSGIELELVGGRGERVDGLDVALVSQHHLVLVLRPEEDVAQVQRRQVEFQPVNMIEGDGCFYFIYLISAVEHRMHSLFKLLLRIAQKSVVTLISIAVR